MTMLITDIKKELLHTIVFSELEGFKKLNIIKVAAFI